MNIGNAYIGMPVIGQHDWAGMRGRIVSIVPSSYQARVRLLRIRLENGVVSTWHPDHCRSGHDHRMHYRLAQRT